MIPLMIKFVVMQNIKFTITLQGKHILEFLFFYLKDSTVSYPGIEFSHLSKIYPKIVHCNLKLPLKKFLCRRVCHFLFRLILYMLIFFLDFINIIFIINIYIDVIHDVPVINMQ